MAMFNLLHNQSKVYIEVDPLYLYPMNHEYIYVCDDVMKYARRT